MAIRSLQAWGAVTRVTSMGTLVVFGFLKGFQPIAGFSYGAKKFDRLREAIKTSIIWSTSFCLVVGLVMAVFSTQIISQFTEGDTQMISAGQKSLFANGITFILFGFYTVYSSLFLALGKGAAGFFLGACRQGVCFVPVVFAAAYGMGNERNPICPTHRRCNSVVSLYLWRYTFIGNCLWLKNRLCPIRKYKVLLLDFYYQQ